MTTRIRSFFWLCLAIPGFFVDGGCSCDPELQNPCIPGEEFACNLDGMSVCVLNFPDRSTLCRYQELGYNAGYCPDDIEPYFSREDCAWLCGENPVDHCLPPPKMQPGYMAQYLDSVTYQSGGQEHVAISGYSPGWLDEGNVIWPYGDLVFADFTSGGDEIVSFDAILDGKPEPSIDNIWFDPAGYRGGNLEAGDDVGKYSSIATDAGALYIAYSDFTMVGSYKLKLAYRPAGATEFAISVIDDSALVAQGGAFYPSITVVGGHPVVAYGVRVAATTPGTQPSSFVRVATASSAAPSGAGSWSFGGDPLRAESEATAGCVDGDGLCAEGDRCYADGTSGRGKCGTPMTGCTQPDPNNVGQTIPLDCSAMSMFGTTVFCVENTCQTVKKGGDLVDATGLFNQLMTTETAGELALVYHDRSAGRWTGTACDLDAQCSAVPYAVCSGAVNAQVANDGQCVVPNGNLWGVRFTGGSWSARFLVDGYSRNSPIVDDSGQRVSLYVETDPGEADVGTWHLAYLDGTFDRIRYARVAAGATVPTFATASGVVDDGTADNTPPVTRPADRADGNRRLVGGEIAITRVAGELRVLYQDQTGPQSVDPQMPIGTQPLFATSSDNGLTWTIDYAATGTQNSGWWTTQARAAGDVSYCIWVERAANVNDGAITSEPTPDGAWTHVRVCP